MGRPSDTAKVEGKVQILDLQGYTVLPGLVGMHNHLFFPEGGAPPLYSDMGISFPRSLSGARGNDDSHHRERDTLHGFGSQTPESMLVA